MPKAGVQTQKLGLSPHFSTSLLYLAQHTLHSLQALAKQTARSLLFQKRDAMGMKGKMRNAILPFLHVRNQ